MSKIEISSTDSIGDLYAALEAMELVAARQQRELDHLRKVSRAAQLMLAVIELEPWRLTAQTFGPIAEKANAQLVELRRLLALPTV